MTEPPADPSSSAPFGTRPRRRAWPLAVLIVVFSLWFALLVALALRYPARP